MLGYQAFHHKIANSGKNESNARGLKDIQFDNLLEPLHDQIGAEGENHD